MAQQAHEEDELGHRGDGYRNLQELKERGAGRKRHVWARAHLKFVDGHPRVGGEALEHGDEELEAARPVANQKHHADQVEDAHEHAQRADELQTVEEERGLIGAKKSD